MAKKKGGRRPPKNIELLRGSNSKQQSVKEIIKKAESEKGLTHVQRYEKRKAEAAKEEPKSQIILKNKIEEAKKQPHKEPDKAKEPQKTKQHEIDKE